MAYAWSQLQLALKAVAGADDERTGLIRAFNKLSNLRTKDLPAEARNDFADLTERMRVNQRNRFGPDEVKEHVASLTDAEVRIAISKIIAMRDAVAYYQPLPRHVTAAKRPHVFGEHSYC
jgi:hypothetical protein